METTYINTLTTVVQILGIWTAVGLFAALVIARWMHTGNVQNDI